MVTEYTNGATGEDIRVNGKIIKWMARENFPGLTEVRKFWLILGKYIG